MIGSARLVMFAALVVGFPAVAQSPGERAMTDGFVTLRLFANGMTLCESLELAKVGDSTQGFSLRKQERSDLISAVSPCQARASTFAGAVTYAGWLPAGEYRFLRLSSHWIEDRHGGIDLDGMLPNFSVAAGRLTDLGTLVQQAVGPTAATVVPWDDSAGFGAIGDTAFAEVAAVLADPPILWHGTDGWAYREGLVGWFYRREGVLQPFGPGLDYAWPAGIADSADRYSLQNQWAQVATPDDLIHLSKRATPPLGRPAFDGEGSAYFASALGQVLQRSSDGAWRNLDTGLMTGITAVFVDADGIYASGSDGRLLFSGDGGTEWVTASLPAQGTVTDIARLPGGDFLIAITSTPEADRLILRGADFLALPPAPWKRIPLARRQDRFPTGVYMESIGERLIVLSVPRQLLTYDVRTDTWNQPEVSRDQRMLFVNAGAGILYTVGARAGLLSIDGGATWQETRLGTNTESIGFRTARDGVRMVLRIGWGMRSGSPYFVEATSDGGNTWAEEAQVPGGCAINAVYLPPSDDLVCADHFGRIISSHAGAEWLTERLVY